MRDATRGRTRIKHAANWGWGGRWHVYRRTRGGGGAHGGGCNVFLDGGGTGTLASTFLVEHQQCPITGMSAARTHPS